MALPYSRPAASTNDAPNNLYVKHIPESWNENRIKKEFSKFGLLKSVKLCHNKFGPYAFVCFEDPNDSSAGAKAAKAAQDELDGKPTTENPDLKLFVKPHMKKEKFEKEKQSAEINRQR